MDILVRFLGGDPDSLGAYFASPVTMETIAMYPVATYGSAMTPFYSTLAIWVGSTILVALVKVKASPKGLENVQSYQLYFGRYLLFFLLAQIQAAIIVAGDLWLLKVNIVEPGLFFLAASFTATAFSLLIYSLTLAFGDVGKAVCVIVMVLQIAGSSGTFPIELLPDTYQKIYIFFPFPYAIRAMRETLAGMYGTAYMEALAKLSLFMIEGLLIGLVIRIPFVKLNHFVEERMEDTEFPHKSDCPSAGPQPCHLRRAISGKKSSAGGCLRLQRFFPQRRNARCKAKKGRDPGYGQGTAHLGVQRPYVPHQAL